MRAVIYTLIGLLLLVPAVALAQTQFGNIRGAVRDADGGVLPGTTVTLTNAETGQARNSITNERGEYVFARVAPGRYNLHVELTGFAPFSREALEIGVDTNLVQDVTLQVGGIAESVTVTGETPLIETASASVASAIDKAQMEVLPTPGRNVFIMAVTTPNVVHAGDPVFVRMQDQTNASLLSLSGGPLRGNNYTLDGVALTDFINRSAINPSFEALEEMKVQISTYDAEMGGTSGGVFNSIHKSGSNNWQGSGLYQWRPTWGRSPTFFEDRAGQDASEEPYHLWGGSFGGPIVRDKAFFWWAHEGYKNTSSRNNVLTFPSRAMANGDFSALPIQLFDLQTGNPIPGNVIPEGMRDPVGVNLANQLADVGEACGATGPTGGDCSITALNRNKAWQMSGNANVSVTDNWQMTGTYMYYESEEPSDPFYEAVFGSQPAYDLGGAVLFRDVNVVAINSTHITGDTSVLTLRYGYNRFNDSPVNPDFTSQDAIALGWDADTMNALNLRQFPNISAEGYGDGDSTHGSWSTADRVHTSQEISGVYSMFAGSHTIKFGGSFRNSKIDWFRAGPLTLNAKQRFSGGPGSPGDGLASLILGHVNTGSAEIASEFSNFVNYFGGFVQDDWRVNDDLVLNLGLRLEHATGMQEQNDQLITGWGFDTPFPVQAPPLSLTGGVLYAGVDGQQTETGDPPALKVGPRAGFAYTVNDSTVIRGGYGLFWAPLNTGQNPSITGYGGTGFGSSTSLVNFERGGSGTLSDPFPQGVNPIVGNQLGQRTNVAQNITFLDQRNEHPYIQKFSFDVQKEFGQNIVFSVGFVGSRGTNLSFGGVSGRPAEINQLDPDIAAATGAALNDEVANPMFGVAGLGDQPEMITRGQLLRPFPQFQNVRTVRNIARSEYESVRVQLEKRFRGNWGARFNYTWSRQDDNVYENANRLSDETTVIYVTSRFDDEFGPARISSPHWFNLSGIYRFPSPDGGGAAEAILGGWSVSMTTIMRSGFPVVIRQTDNWGGAFGYQHQRPNLTGADPVTSGSTEDRVDNYFNEAAYEFVPDFQIGNTPHTDDDVRSPWLFNWDLSFEKQTSIAGNQNFNIRLEFINFFNQPNWNGPRTVFGRGNFGQIQGQGGYPRVFQLMLKYSF